MSEWRLKPMGTGSMLDLGFQIYRNHFTTFFLLMLLLFGPFQLLQQLFVYDIRRMAWLPEVPSGDWFERSVFRLESDEPSAGLAGLLIELFVVAPVFLFGVLPVAIASVLWMVRAILQGEKPGLKEALAKSFRWFWPLCGSSLLFGLVMAGGMIALSIVFFVIVFIFVAIAGLTGAGLIAIGSPDVVGGTAFIAMVIVMYLAMLLFFSVGISFFTIRLGYYLPTVAFGEDGIGFGRSWSLTKGNYWRLFAMFAVLCAIYFVFALGPGLFSAVFGPSIVGQLAEFVLTLLLTPLMFVPYAVSYFDLKIRKEGPDLEWMIRRTVRGEPGPGESGPGWAANPANTAAEAGPKTKVAPLASAGAVTEAGPVATAAISAEAPETGTGTAIEAAEPVNAATSVGPAANSADAVGSIATVAGGPWMGPEHAAPMERHAPTELHKPSEHHAPSEHHEPSGHHTSSERQTPTDRRERSEPGAASEPGSGTGDGRGS